MAIVPMPNGPKVNPSVQQADNISLIAPQESKAEKAALADYDKSANYLSKAVDTAYERFSKAKADEAYNNIRLATDEIMQGQDGALRKQGSQTLDGDKPFVDDYMGRIKDVVSRNAEGLDVYQKRILQRRVGRFMANRHAELTRHQIIQAEAYEKGVAKTQGEIAARSIAVDPLNIESVKRAREDIEESVRALNPGAPEEAIRMGIDDTTSKAFVQGAEAAIANGEPEKAQALLNHYLNKGITPYDALSLQPKIKKALLEKMNNAQVNQAVQIVTQACTPRGVAQTTLTAGDGMPFDSKRYGSVTKFVTDKGKPEWAAAAYLLGEAETKELLDRWDARGQDIQKRLQESKRGSDAWLRAKDELSRFASASPLEEALTGTNKTAYENYCRQMEKIYTGDKATIREQVLSLNPDIDEKTLDKTVSAIHEQRERAIHVRQVQANQQASNLFAQLQNGARFSDIPETSKDKLTDAQLRGFIRYDKRRAVGGPYTTDSALYGKYRYNNAALKALKWPDLYAMADSFTSDDFNTLVSRKQTLESGKVSDDDPKGIESMTRNVMQQLNLVPQGTKGKAVYNRVFRTIVEHVTDAANSDYGKGWDEDRIRKEVQNYATRKFYMPDSFLFYNYKSGHTVGEVVAGKPLNSGSAELDLCINAALRSAGYVDPQDVDRSEFIVDYVLNMNKELPGEEAFVSQMPERFKNEYRAQFVRETRGAEPTTHDYVRAYLQDRLSEDENK